MPPKDQTTQTDPLFTDIVTSYYGSYRNMFEIHDWPERSAEMVKAAPQRIIGAYGSLQRFVELHSSEGLMPPMQAILADPPNVWLTSYYGFNPEGWGLLGFTDPGMRNDFIRESDPGVLVVIYGTTKAEKDEAQKIIGIQQCSHEPGRAEDFMSPSAWQWKQADPESARKWNHAIKAKRAWRVTSESRMPVREFAPKSTRSGAWQHIGARGVRLTPEEARNILKLDLQETDVYGEGSILAALPGPAKAVLAPSKAGPVSQNPFVTREAEGPKHLYILRLMGDEDAFLGEAANGHFIVKAGFSKSPQSRCCDHNKALPWGAYRWEVLFSGAESGYDPYPDSQCAKIGEKAMQKVLCRSGYGRSLGGEFFLAAADLIDEAWHAGNLASREYTK